MRFGGLLLLLLFSLACSSGQNSGGTAAPAPGPATTGILRLSVNLEDLARAAHRIQGGVLQIRVVDPSGQKDLVAITEIPLFGESVVTASIINVPPGQARILLTLLDQARVPLAHSQSQVLTVVPGANSFSLTLNTNQVNRLVFLTQPSGTLVNQPIVPAVQVAVVDSGGNVVTGFNQPISLQLQSNPGGATLGGTLTVNPVNGVATFSNLTLSQPGVGNTLLATATGVTSATSNSFDVASAVGPPARLAFATQPVNTVVGVAIAPAVQVVVQDAAGVTVPTATAAITLAFGNNPGGATLGGTLTRNAVNGVASFDDVTVSQFAPGYTLAASSAGLTSATSASFDILPPFGPATQLRFRTQPASGQARQILNLVEVEVLDANGLLVTTAANPITLGLASNPGPATLTGPLTVNAVNGVAGFNNLKLSKSGIGYTLSAASFGLTPATSLAFNQSLPRGALSPIAGMPVGGLSEPKRGRINPTGQFLYVTEFLFGGPGTVEGYSINAATGLLTLLPSSPFFSGAQPGGMAIATDNATVYVSNAFGGNITLFTLNPVTGALGAFGGTAAGANPLDLEYRNGPTPYLYCMNFASNDVSAFDASPGILVPLGPAVGTGGILGPSDGRLHPNGNFLYTNNGGFFSINPATGVLTFQSQFGNGLGSWVNPVLVKLFQGGATLNIFNIPAATGTPTAVGGSPFAVTEAFQDVRVSPDGTVVYALSQASGNVRIYELTGTGPVEFGDSPVNVGAGGFQLIEDPLSRFLYVTNDVAGQVHGFSIVP